MRIIIFYILLLTTTLLGQTIPEYSVHNIKMDSRLNLDDFVLMKFSENYWDVFARLSNVSSTYIEWVELEYIFYFSGDRVSQKSSFLDYDTYENSGLVPNSTGLITSLTEIIQFDSMTFNVIYQTDTGLRKFLEYDALGITSTQFNDIVFNNTYKDWIGSVRNTSATPIKYPQVFACFLLDNKLVRIENTYLNLTDSIIQPNVDANFDVWVILPETFNQVLYLTHYSIDLTDEVIMPSSIKLPRETINSFEIGDNYPNPFNATTTINYQIIQPSFVELNVYNNLGLLVLPVFKKYHISGNHKIMINLQDYPSGIYYYEFKCDGELVIKSMVLVK